MNAIKSHIASEFWGYCLCSEMTFYNNYVLVDALARVRYRYQLLMEHRVLMGKYNYIDLKMK
jgi:hypothetical protein